MVEQGSRGRTPQVTFTGKSTPTSTVTGTSPTTPGSGIEVSSVCYVCCRSTFTRQPPQAFLHILRLAASVQTCRSLEVGEPS